MAFVKSTDRRYEHIIQICWGLIAAKSVLVVWLVQRYAMPFHPLWVIGPTVGLAAVATALFYLHRE
jgi:hypothetical protein